VAYYVAKAGSEASITEWRNYLRSKLPEYMVPQHFVKLEAMPLTPNGKVDRKALPKLEVAKASEKNYIAPRTDMERQIVDIWQEVLKQEKVGVCDDFFEVGGHSLLATQVLARINRIFNMQLPLLRLFESRTVEKFAEVVDAFSWAARGRQEVGSSRNENKDREFVEL
jgi:acyl carrier protein